MTTPDRLLAALPDPWPARGCRNALGTACAVCGGFGPHAVCAGCRAAFVRPGPRCRRCALRLPPGATACAGCRSDTLAFDRAVAAVDYAGPWRALVLRYKQTPQPALARPLASLLADALATDPDDAPPDVLLAVPADPARLRQRGLDAAWALAREVARLRGLPAWPDGLMRLRALPAQAGLDRAHRQANLHNALAVPAPAARRLASRHVALVDDVLTTGATADAAARALRAAGAARVSVWVVARTPTPDAADAAGH